METTRNARFARWAATAAVAAMALGAVGTAQARDQVYFSVNAAVAPGVNVGVSNVPVISAPVYVQPAPVYYPVAATYYPPAPIVVRPAPVVAPVVYAAPGWHRGHRHHHPYYWGYR